MAGEAETRIFFPQQATLRGTVGGMTGSTFFGRERLVENRSWRWFQFLVAGKAQAAGRLTQQGRLIGGMGIVALGAGAGANRTVDIFPAEIIAFVTFQTQRSLVILDRQQELPGSAMSLMTAQAIPLGHRFMDNLAGRQEIMAIGAQSRPGRHQDKTPAAALAGMIGSLPLVAFQALAFSHRRMGTGDAGHILVAGRRHA